MSANDHPTTSRRHAASTIAPPSAKDAARPSLAVPAPPPGRAGRRAPRKLGASVLLALLLAGCLPGPEPGAAQVGGQVLVAPGVGLAGARVTVQQLRLDDADAAVRATLGATVTDEQGHFGPLPVGTANGLVLVRVAGGRLRDPLTGEPVWLDDADELRAVHWLELLEDRGDSLLVTPIHTLIEARFRAELAGGAVPAAALRSAYEVLGDHLGEVDWQRVRPAALDQPAAATSAELRAALVLGGLAVFADDVRQAAAASPRQVNAVTVASALARDLASGPLDGNDGGDPAPGSGVQLGPCQASAEPCVPPAASACSAGACRPLCDAYANSLRALLAGGVAKLLGTRAAPSAWNRTTLGVEDVRGLLARLEHNPEPRLFGATCVEPLDRLPPSVGWLSPTTDQRFVRGEVALWVVATDDSGVAPAVWLAGVPEEDGDPANSLARGTLRTAELPDGELELRALAIDRTGNLAHTRRVVEVDNTPPGLALDPAGFVVDDRGWWTASAAPTLRGQLVEPHLRRLTATAAGHALAPVVSGGRFELSLPAALVTDDGVEVSLRAEDAAGNVATATARVRRDVRAPALAPVLTAVRDERGDVISFEGAAPLHHHQGPIITLGGEGCPLVYKHTSLLDEAPPPYGGELPGANPLRWRFALTDDGAGLAGAEVRVRAGAEVLLDWRPVPLLAVGGQWHAEITLTRDGALAVPALATRAAELELELRAIDRLGHVATATRCWRHVPLAPPLYLEPARVPAPPGAAGASPLALWAHGLDGAHLQDLGALLLDEAPRGAAILEAPVINGSAEPVYVTLALRATAGAGLTRAFSVVHAPGDVESVDESCAAAPAACARVPAAHSESATFADLRPALEVRLYTADAGGAPLVEVAPCAEPGCVASTTARTYRLPPRAGASPPRFVALAWLRQLPELRPASAAWPAAPPFSDFVHDGHRYTGVHDEVAYCTRVAERGIPRASYCTERTSYRRRQSLDSATLALPPLELSVTAAAGPSLPLGAALTALLTLPAQSYTTAEQ